MTGHLRFRMFDGNVDEGAPAPGNDCDERDKTFVDDAISRHL